MGIRNQDTTRRVLNGRGDSEQDLQRAELGLYKRSERRAGWVGRLAHTDEQRGRCLGVAVEERDGQRPGDAPEPPMERAGRVGRTGGRNCGIAAAGRNGRGRRRGQAGGGKTGRGRMAGRPCRLEIRRGDKSLENSTPLFVKIPNRGVFVIDGRSRHLISLRCERISSSCSTAGRVRLSS